MPESIQSDQRSRVSRPLLFTGLAAPVAFLALNGHGDHLLSLAPLLILLACPLMHLFMHHGHNGHHEGGRNGSAPIDGGPAP